MEAFVTQLNDDLEILLNLELIEDNDIFAMSLNSQSKLFQKLSKKKKIIKS